MADLITNTTSTSSNASAALAASSFARLASAIEQQQQAQQINFSQRTTILIDLDETLIHSSFEKPEFYSFSLSIPFNDNNYDIYVQVRPGAENFLRTLCGLCYNSNTSSDSSSTGFIFDVFIFTASMAEYAVPVMQRIAPWFPSCRVLTRQHCTCLQNQVSNTTIVVKDLTIFKDRSISKMILVDNAAESFLLQPQNGILVSTWIGDVTDTVLIQDGPGSLMHFLKVCAMSDDVRSVISQAFPDIQSRLQSLLQTN